MLTVDKGSAKLKLQYQRSDSSDKLKSSKGRNGQPATGLANKQPFSSLNQIYLLDKARAVHDKIPQKFPNLVMSPIAVMSDNNSLGG